jgi:hypothetical protein
MSGRFLNHIIDVFKGYRMGEIDDKRIRRKQDSS